MSHQHNNLSKPASKDSRAGHKVQFNRGLRCLGIGIGLMAISFLINMLFFQTDRNFLMTMYVLTSTGAIAILFGLWCMLEG